MLYQGFAVTKQGYGHKEKNIVCQDWSDFIVPESSFSIVAASDGHGSEKHFRSDTGSKLAVEVSLRQVEEFLRDHQSSLIQAGSKERNKILHDLENNLILNWRDAVQKNYGENILNETEEEICRANDMDKAKPERFYGATLLVGVLTLQYAFAMQIGDGVCVFMGKNIENAFPVPEDDRLGFGLTTSLCDSNAINSFRHYFTPREDITMPEAIFVSTDGVVDSYESDAFLNFNKAILKQMKEDPVIAKSQLEEWLPQLSERGSRDDMTIAGIYKITHPDCELVNNPDNLYS